MSARIAPWSVVSLLAACGAPELGPLARLSLTPALLCEGQPPTPVIFDGSGSLPPAGTDEPLAFTWELTRSPVEVVRGGFDEEVLVVLLPTVSPIGVSLIVRTRDGTSNRREEVLPLTRGALRACALGCATSELCARVAGEELCVLDRACSDDSECGCLRCGADDRGQPFCLPW